jgi:hypothetical protein
LDFRKIGIYPSNPTLIEMKKNTFHNINIGVAPAVMMALPILVKSHCIYVLSEKKANIKQKE